MRISLYVPGDSWVHRLDPITKLWIVVTAVVLTFALPNPVSQLSILSVSLLVLVGARVLRHALPVFAGVFIIAATFFIVQGLVYPGNVEPVLTLGPATFYREGLSVGLHLALRLYNILAATLVLVLVTSPSAFVEALVRRGLPPRLGYVLVSVLQIVPTMVASAQTIQDAQRSRGMETEGNLWVRIRAFIPLIGPLVASSLIATEERALALEVRGFGENRRPTFLNEEVIPTHAWVVRALVLVALVLGLGSRWFAG